MRIALSTTESTENTEKSHFTCSVANVFSAVKALLVSTFRSVLVAAVTVLGSASLPAFAHGEVTSKAAALSDAPHLAVIKPAPDFALVDTNGQPVQLRQLRGRTVLLAFVFTACSSACPLISHQMSVLQGHLTQAGLLPRRVVLLSVTVDPERDTAEVLAQYAKRFAARPGWHFLRDTLEKMRPMLAGYDEWTRKLPNGEVDHPARIYLIDPAGRIREIYSLAFFDERQALIDIQAVDKERGRTPAEQADRVVR